MGRLFEEHYIRNIKSLDGAWDFIADQADCGKDEEWYFGIPAGEKVIVPSVWTMQKNTQTYEGVCWYEKDFYSEGGCIRLCFGAVMTEAEVWFDGKPLGTHYGGFSQFEFLIPDVEPGTHRIIVRVDNRFHAQSIPQAYVDWYHHGGIIRSVTIESLKGICILSDKLEYVLSDDLKSVTGNFTLELFNAENKPCTSKLLIKLGNQIVHSGTVESEARERLCITIPEFQIDNISLWDTEHPHLYEVYIETDSDDLRDRVGFRKVAIENERILLNGREIELRGVNRHEEHPEFGFAFPMNLMKRDIDMIVEMGCNAIRGSHYPNSKEFVDFLDERGILFWSEIPIWGGGFSEDVLADPVVLQRGFEMHCEMIKYYYNHPSIIIWGMHNEILSNTQAAYIMSEKYYRYLKENGGNRLVVYASNHAMDDICFAFTDCICLNQYLGWYEGSMECWQEYIDNFIKRRNELGFQDKPVIISEFGCEGLYGCHDHEDIFWSEEYQAKLISYCVSLFRKHPSIVGNFIWQFCDTKTCNAASLKRARGFNNKGIVNEYRKPKRAYYAVLRLYLDLVKKQKM